MKRLAIAFLVACIAGCALPPKIDYSYIARKARIAARSS
jgi:hypothetical protein